jgi:DNA gyrase inhibitor GyrI
MDELEVRIVRLESMRVAYALGFGTQPERQAWTKILTWAHSKDILNKPEVHRFFGFNNPDPAPGSPNYGYEQWITVDPAAQAEGEIRIKDFPGGLYAVTRCTLNVIGETWKRLVAWKEASSYHWGAPPFLEAALTPPKSVDDIEARPFDEIVLDLYLPISE